MSGSWSRGSPITMHFLAGAGNDLRRHRGFNSSCPRRSQGSTPHHVVGANSFLAMVRSPFMGVLMLAIFWAPGYIQQGVSPAS